MKNVMNDIKALKRECEVLRNEANYYLEQLRKNGSLTAKEEIEFIDCCRRTTLAQFECYRLLQIMGVSLS